VEQHGEYRSGVYQEMARGFGLGDYRQMMETGKANETRLRTPIEFKNKQLGSEGFGSTLLRHLLFAIKETHEADDPRIGRDYLHQEPSVNYWENRQRLVQLLDYMDTRTSYIPHWKADVEALRNLRGFVQNDRV
jgi:hypothetical protein